MFGELGDTDKFTEKPPYNPSSPYSASKPVVATAHGGSIEMFLDSKTGVLIPWNDVSSSYEIIKPLLISKNLRDQYGENGFNRVK